MAKTSGGVRNFKQGSTTYQKRQAEVETMRASGQYSSGEMGKGGWVAIEKSTAKHKPEEIEAAKILADKGYKVTLKNEATRLHGVKTPDGYLFNASFEQRTPTGTSTNNFKNALEHARNKGADLALIYDKHHVYHRSTVENGLKQYEANNNYRFNRIIVIAHDGKIHRHKHNK